MDKRNTTMNPDCRDGKHAACSGDGWDTATDCYTPCPCACHGHFSRTPKGAK